MKQKQIVKKILPGILSLSLVLGMTTTSFAMGKPLQVTENPVVLSEGFEVSNEFRDDYIALSQSIIKKDFQLSIMDEREKNFLDYMLSQESSFGKNRKLTLYYLNKDNNSGIYFGKSVRVISVDHAGTAINIVIDLALLATGEGGIAQAGIKSLVQKYGVTKAKKMIEEKVVVKVVNKLASWGLKGIAAHTFRIVGIVIDNILDPGHAIASWIDNNIDANRGNGYIDI